MSERRIIIGAIGGDKQKDAAYAFGHAVAELGCILLTGGGDKDDEEVKNAAFQGMLGLQSGQRFVPRSVGVLPATQVAWDWPLPTHLLLHSGLTHNVRNLINGVTPDVVVVFGGGRGTLAELGFAAAAGKQLFFYGGPQGGAVARLRRNLSNHFQQNAADVDIYLGQPLAAFPNAFSGHWTETEILTLIDSTLQTANDWKGSARDLVQCCMQKVRVETLNEKSGFPGLPGQLDACQLFESAIQRISTAA
jgi:hypothetical protein